MPLFTYSNYLSTAPLSSRPPCVLAMHLASINQAPEMVYYKPLFFSTPFLIHSSSNKSSTALK